MPLAEATCSVCAWDLRIECSELTDTIHLLADSVAHHATTTGHELTPEDVTISGQA